MKVELELPAEVAWIMKIYATILDKTVEEHIMDSLRESAENLGDGEVLGEEVAAIWKDLTKKQADPTSSS